MRESRLAVRRLRNLAQSAVLLGGLAVLAGLMGWLVAGAGGLAWALAGAAGLLLFSPRFSPGMVLRLYGARRLAPEEVPAVHAALAELARRAGLPGTPALFYVPSRVENAFTVGSAENSAVAVTDGLLRGLTPRELVGVLAHEMAHVRHGDTWIMGLADVIGALTGFFSTMGKLLLLINLPLIVMGDYHVPWLPVLLLLFSPTIAALLQLALSRAREVDADMVGAQLAGDAEGLAQALAKLELHQAHWLDRLLRPGRGNPHPSVLRTHPETAERIARLRELAPEIQGPPVAELLLRHAPQTPGRFARVDRPPRSRIGGRWF